MSTTITDTEKQRRRAVLASYIGTTLEYYDFLLYGVAAALVFPHIFFVSLDPLAAMLSSFATFAVGYFARPLGAIILGISVTESAEKYSGHYPHSDGNFQLPDWSDSHLPPDWHLGTHYSCISAYPSGLRHGR